MQRVKCFVAERQAPTQAHVVGPIEKMIDERGKIFDPFTQRDFYSLGAFFADIKEPVLGRREDGMPVPDEEQTKELARLDPKDDAVKQKQSWAHPVIANGKLYIREHNFPYCYNIKATTN